MQSPHTTFHQYSYKNKLAYASQRLRRQKCAKRQAIITLKYFKCVQLMPLEEDSYTRMEKETEHSNSLVDRYYSLQHKLRHQNTKENTTNIKRKSDDYFAQSLNNQYCLNMQKIQKEIILRQTRRNRHTRYISLVILTSNYL